MADIDHILKAYGGRERWQAVDRVMARLSMGGTGFLSRMHPRPFRDVEVAADLRAFRITFSPFPGEGLIGVFEPSRVYIQSDDGSLIEDRPAPGAITRSPRHWLIWDKLDLLYVAGLLTWQSMLLPWLLARSGVAGEGLEPVEDHGESLERLDVHFPADLPLPSPRQRLFVSRPGYVRRVEYSPSAYGGFLPIAHLLEDEQPFDGLVLPARQSLYPCLPASPFVWAGRLAWLDFSDFGVSREASGAEA